MSTPPGAAAGYHPFDWTPESSALLGTVLERVAQLARAGLNPVAGFDLDGCVFDTRPRQVHILHELAALRGWNDLCRVRTEHFQDWSMSRTLEAAGLDPAWVAAHATDIRSFWADRFFASDYMLHDHAMPGAAPFVRAVAEAGARIVYLTGRDHRMRPGTEQALRRFHFPYDRPQTLLLTKPDAKQDDTAFKESAMERIAQEGLVAAYFDNEPANVNLFLRHHPEAIVVFVETDHSPRPDRPHPHLPWIRSFLRAPA